MLENLQWTDIVLLSVILLSTLLGFLRGFTREFFTVFNLGLATLVALKLPPIIVNFADIVLGIKDLSKGLIMTVLFAFTTMILSKYTKKINKKYSHGIINKIFGAGFGFARGMLIAVVIIGFAVFSLLVHEKEWKKTPFVQSLHPFTQKFTDLVPDKIEQKIAEKLKSFDNLATFQALKKMSNTVYNTKFVVNEDKDEKGDKTDKKTATDTKNSKLASPLGAVVNDAAKAIKEKDPKLQEQDSKLQQIQNRLFGGDSRAADPAIKNDRAILLNKLKANKPPAASTGQTTIGQPQPTGVVPNQVPVPPVPATGPGSAGAGAGGASTPVQP